MLLSFTLDPSYFLKFTVLYCIGLFKNQNCIRVRAANWVEKLEGLKWKEVEVEVYLRSGIYLKNILKGFLTSS